MIRCGCLLHAHRAVEEVFCGEFAQRLFQNRYGLWQDALVEKAVVGTATGHDFIGIGDAVEDRDIYVYIETV